MPFIRVASFSLSSQTAIADLNALPCSVIKDRIFVLFSRKKNLGHYDEDLFDQLLPVWDFV